LYWVKLAQGQSPGVRSRCAAAGEITHEQARGETVTVRGHAWAGENEVTEVWISTDFGLNWEKTEVSSPMNRYAWVQFEKQLSFPNRGYFEIWARAVDNEGNTQPIVQPWNPRGYEGNLVHKVPVTVAA
jgi:hypothetical protein